MIVGLPRSTLFPYTTLFRSGRDTRLDRSVAIKVMAPHFAEDTELRRRSSVSSAKCGAIRSEEHTSELQSQFHLVCRLLLEKKKKSLIQSLLKLITLILTLSV